MNYGPLIISINGYHLSEEEIILLQNAYVGGVILFASNHQSMQQLQALTAEIKDCALQTNRNMMIMVDHEGGYVQRFRTDFTAVPAERVLGDIYDIDPETALQYAYQLGTIVGSELQDAGIDVVLGPVVDLDMGNRVISGLDRAYHDNPMVVTDIATAYIEGIQASDIQVTLKHFPGHGADVGDSHISEPVDVRTLEEIYALDLVPFQQLIENDLAQAIMPAHIIYSNIDPDHTAGTSSIWLQDILRGELHFDGVIISDCLSMTGAGDGNNVDKILSALEYGDLALLSHQSISEYSQIVNSLAEQQYVWSQDSQNRVTAWLDTGSHNVPCIEQTLVESCIYV